MSPVDKGIRVAMSDRQMPSAELLHKMRQHAKASNPGILGTVVGCIKGTLGYLGGSENTTNETNHAKQANDCSSSTALFCVDYESGISPRPVGRLLMLQKSKGSEGRPTPRPSRIVVPRKEGTSLHKFSRRPIIVNGRDDDSDNDDDDNPAEGSGLRLSIDMQKDGTRVNLYPTKSLSNIKRRRGLQSILKRRKTTPRERVLMFDIDDDDDQWNERSSKRRRRRRRH